MGRVQRNEVEDKSLSLMKTPSRPEWASAPQKASVVLGYRQKPADIFKVGAIKCYLGTGAESSVRVCKQSMRTCKLCKCLSTCLLDFWESTGKLCAKQPATHPIFCHNPSSQSSWFFCACHTPDFLSYFCHRYIHQEGNNWRPSHAFMVSPGFEARTSGKKLSILNHPKCKLYLGELEFSSFITAWAS